MQKITTINIFSKETKNIELGEKYSKEIRRLYLLKKGKKSVTIESAL